MKIQQLCLYTSNIPRQYHFFKEELGMKILNYSENSFEVACGYSILKFEYQENHVPAHYAFHIPDEQEEEALGWLEKVVPVLKYNDQEIVDFSNWKAKSIYFHDKDQNIVELISRRDFSKPQVGIFTAENIVGIAEIGLATSAIKPVFEKLSLTCGLQKYDGNFDKFCAIGEDSGLFIVVKEQEKEWFPTKMKAKPSDFKLNFEHLKKNFQLEFVNGKVLISE